MGSSSSVSTWIFFFLKIWLLLLKQDFIQFQVWRNSQNEGSTFFYFNFHKSEHVDPYAVSKKLYQVCLHYWNSCTSFGPLAVAGRVLWVRVCLSVLPYFHSSVLLPGKFLGIGSLAFSSWQSLNFCEKKTCSKSGPKVGFFEFIGKFSHCFFLNLVYKESLLFIVFFYKSHN